MNLNAVRTKLGWVLMGGKSSKLEKSVTDGVCLVHSIDEINLEQFWNINYVILSKNDPKMLTRDETRAMNILETTTTLKDKHVIGLLWKTDNPKLPMNRESAENRLVSLEKRLERNPVLKKGIKNNQPVYIERLKLDITNTSDITNFKIHYCLRCRHKV